MRGFTLIELIITMVVLAILALGITSYIGLGARMYTDVAEREQLLGQSRFVAERMVRELRNALPNSVKVDNDCLEFMPIKTVGLYQTLTASTVELSWLKEPAQAGDFLVIYPQNPQHAVADRMRSISSISGNSMTFTGGAFPYESPAKRFYVYSETVRYCRTGSTITRNGILMAQQVRPDTRFEVTEPTLQRNALINLYLSFGDAGTDMFFNYEVHIPNVP
ncbi:MSHA biogenesis protein MshO [Rheinheimera pacifica]|uniref:PilW family protein n=1 Tax=Rheinheimera pacifica TaxID=173990 RepID=UPI002169DB6D|nr:type II secretion system protein [Rheinheimera pacifica]MCS4308890.1 MSHA biogenesis protein MshO [Rheinheimera pacifica]